MMDKLLTIEYTGPSAEQHANALWQMATEEQGWDILPAKKLPLRRDELGPAESLVLTLILSMVGGIAGGAAGSVVSWLLDKLWGRRKTDEREDLRVELTVKTTADEAGKTFTFSLNEAGTVDLHEVILACVDEEIEETHPGAKQ